MKKTNLITTLALVVIVAIALSTATFAWYSNQSQVGTSKTTLYSAKSSSASLAIDSTYSATSTTIELALSMDNATNGISPMIPKAAPTASTTKISEFEFQTDIQTANGYFVKGAHTATPATSQEFFVINTNANQEATVNVNVVFDTTGYTKLTSTPFDWSSSSNSYFYAIKGTDITKTTPTAVAANATWDDNTNDYYVKNDRIVADLRVALFTGDQTGDLTYLNTWASVASAGTYVCETWSASAKVSETVTNNTDLVPVASAQSLGTIAALGAKKVKVVAWFDGMGLVDAESGLGTAFTINFSVAS